MACHRYSQSARQCDTFKILCDTCRWFWSRPNWLVHERKYLRKVNKEKLLNCSYSKNCDHWCACNYFTWVGWLTFHKYHKIIHICLLEKLTAKCFILTYQNVHFDMKLAFRIGFGSLVPHLFVRFILICIKKLYT